MHFMFCLQAYTIMAVIWARVLLPPLQEHLENSAGLYFLLGIKLHELD
jgi:hypothetical protein